MSKICMVAYTYYERDPRVRREAEALVNDGHSVVVIALRESGRAAHDIYYNVEVIRVPLGRKRGGVPEYLINYSLFFIYSLLYVTFLHLKHRYDLFYTHNMPDFLVFSGIVPKLMGRPVILDVHDPMPEIFSTIFSGRLSVLINICILFQEKISYRFADQLITVSEGMRLLLLKRGVMEDKLEIIHNFPDTSIFPLSTYKQNDNYTFAYVGTISSRHRLDILVQAISKLSDDIPEFQIRIFGDGPALPDLMELARDCKVTDRVTFEGTIPMEKVPDILRDSRAAVASYSDDAYGNLVFPTKVFEALMVGTPVICAKVPAIQKYFDDNTIFYFEPNDINSLIEQIKLVLFELTQVYERMERCNKILMELNWDNEQKKYLALVDQIITEKR